MAYVDIPAILILRRKYVAIDSARQSYNIAAKYMVEAEMNSFG
jgi:hypothetical protein